MSGKVPPSSRARSRKPPSNRRDVMQAVSLYERFSGMQAQDVDHVDVPVLPKVAVNIGECDAVLYTTMRDGVVERYKHTFAAGDKPLLCVSPDGRQLLLLGGRYKFGELGIVDASDHKHRGR